MTGRVQPNEAMRLVLRRIRAHGRVADQVGGGARWITGCPTEGHIAPLVRWDQRNDGTVRVHACVKGCTPDEVIAGLDVGDRHIRAWSPNGQDPFVQPGRTRRQRTPGDGLAIYEKLRAALDDGYDDGRGRTGRYQCPACGARGDGHGLKVDYDPNRSRRILLLCFQGCPVEEILESLGMTKAELCADDDTDDLGEDEAKTEPRVRGGFDRSGVNTPITEEWWTEQGTDLGNARRLVKLYGPELRFVPAWRKWYLWDGRRWAVDNTGAAQRRAKATARWLQQAATIEPDEKRRARLLSWAQYASSVRGLRGMLEVAGTELGIALAPGQLDSHPELLNTHSGTLDLVTGELRPHDPSLHLTKITGAGYDPDASAPEFAKFLERIQPDAEMREFLARLLGHTLTGRITEHILAIFYGTGANGKTTLTEVVRAALGDYAATTDPGLLIDRGEVHPTGVADLFGLRLALTHETDAGRRLAEGTVKRLTGGDRIKARRMREDFWEFDPTHSIVMSTNHKPIITGDDEGIWRRLRLVPFGVVIPEDERDGKLPERLILEMDGVLAWLVAGHRSWRDRGLAEPEPVTTATKEFRYESDLLALFLEERCLLMAHCTVGSSELFAAWIDWCKQENVDAGTQKAFATSLAERGYDKYKDGRGRMAWRGIGLQAGGDEL
jgi:putative DNA primase/helicase